MANVKRRIDAPKKAPKSDFKKKRTVGRPKKSRPMNDKESNNKNFQSLNTAVNKQSPNKNLLDLTPEQKVKYLLQNGQQLKDQQVTGPAVTSGFLRQSRITRSSSDSAPTGCELLVPMKTKNGFLKTSKCKFIMDRIIKNEFSVIPGKVKKPNAGSSKNGVNNNNDTDIANQNKAIISKISKQIKINGQKNTNSPEKNNKPSVQNKKQNVVVVQSLKILTQRSKKSLSKLKLLSQPLTPNVKGQIKKISKFHQIPPTTEQVTLGNGLVVTLPLYVCDYCQKKFNRKHSLVRHIYLHLGRKPHMCPVCPKKFRIMKNLNNHVDRDHCVHTVDDNSQTYACDICDKPFLTKESLQLHLTSHAKGENSFKCVYCDKKFAYQLLLVQHEKKHLITGKYQCTLCDVKFNSRAKLYMHVKSHLKLTDYICQYCGREFLRANSMKRHIQTAHAGRTIQCPICNKKLKGHLTEHMRTHDKKRPHECPDCGKHFAQSTQMKVHRRGHTGFRPYMCRICERPFSHSNALMLHIRRHTGEKPFPCAECPLSFSQLPHMKAHMFKIHSKENPYKCLKCEDYFKLKKDLIFHKKVCTGTGTDTDLYGEIRETQEDSLQDEYCEVSPVESTMSLSRMRFLLALLLTMIASKEKLKYLGFNKRLVDDLLIESLEAMDQDPCKDENMTPLVRLRTNIETLLKGTVPREQMEKFKNENKSTEELLELLTSEKEKS